MRRLRTLCRRAGLALAGNVWELAAAAGVGLIAWGLAWLFHLAMAPLVCGAALLTLGVLGARRWGS